VTVHVFQQYTEIEEVISRVVPRTTPVRGLPITVERLQKSYGQNHVLKGLNFHVPAGEFVVVVGRSGCGKSTLLRLLLNLEQPTSGAFWFGDNNEAPNRNAARVMFQEPRLLPWASVLANVEVGLGDPRRVPDTRDHALEVLRNVGLEDRRDEWPSVLSGGQKQRVALARALVSRPRIMGFDEPLGALDALTRISMQKMVEKVWLDQGFTAIMVTHDVAEAVTLADRILMIKDGEIALDLTIDLPRPRERGSAAVAELEGRILRELFHNTTAGGDT
jgi:sulfonate transport system ATP-binding protein